MSEQGVDLSDPGVLQRTAEPLATHYAGVFFPELVERCVAEAHARLARSARIQTYLVPMAMRLAREHLQHLEAARSGHDSLISGPGARDGQVHQVLVIDEDDTGRSQITAALLAHHGGARVVARSAGFLAGDAVDPLVPKMLTERGVRSEHLHPKALTDDVLRAADRVITFGARDDIHLHPGAVHERWVVTGLFNNTGPERAREIVDTIEAQVENLAQRLHTEAPSSPLTAAPGAA